MTVHPLTATCDRIDTGCACEVFVAANETSGAMFYTHGKELMAKALAALPTTEADAVNATTACRLIQAATDLHPAGARFHLVHAVRDHLVASRLTPGGRYRLWLATPTVAATDLSCQGLQYCYDDEHGTWRHHGRFVTGYLEEIERRGDDHVHGCELIGHMDDESAGDAA